MGLFLTTFSSDQILTFIINKNFYGDNTFTIRGILTFKPVTVIVKIQNFKRFKRMKETGKHFVYTFTEVNRRSAISYHQTFVVNLHLYQLNIHPVFLQIFDKPCNIYLSINKFQLSFFPLKITTPPIPLKHKIMIA